MEHLRCAFEGPEIHAYRWNIPMLMITHDLQDVAALADLVCVIEAGQVVREVDLRSGEQRTRSLQSLCPALSAEVDPARRRGLKYLLRPVSDPAPTQAALSRGRRRCPTA